MNEPQWCYMYPRIITNMDNFTDHPTPECNTTYDIDTEASQYLAYKVAFSIHLYYYPILAPVGIIGNMLSLCVMLRKRNRSLSFCVYLAALAVTDTLVMLSSLYIWSDLSSKSGHFGCMMVCLTFQTSSGSSIGLIFFINFDRYLATCRPFCRLGWRQRRRAVKVTIVIAFFSFLSGVIFSFTSSQINSFTCAGFATGRSITTVLLVLSYLILFAVLPITAVVALNLAIAKTTKQRLSELKYMSIHTVDYTAPSGVEGERREINQSEQRDGGNGQEMDKRGKYSKPGYGDTNDNIDLFTVTGEVMRRTFRDEERSLICCGLFRTLQPSKPSVYNPTNRPSVDLQVSRTLILVTITFFILVLPQFLRYFIYIFFDFKSSASVYATYILLYQISQKMCATNSAINFFIYCLKGSRFRQDVLEIVKVLWCRKIRMKETDSYIDDGPHGTL